MKEEYGINMKEYEKIITNSLYGKLYGKNSSINICNKHNIYYVKNFCEKCLEEKISKRNESIDKLLTE